MFNFPPQSRRFAYFADRSDDDSLTSWVRRGITDSEKAFMVARLAQTRALERLHKNKD